MTVDEFDIQFDILYNNISSNAAPGLDAYEKSVFLSQAHKDIVTDLYSGKSVAGISFESTEEARAYLKDYIKETIIFPSYFSNNNSVITIDLSKEGPILFRIKEFVTTKKLSPITSALPVIPARQDEIINLLKNPFRGPNDNRVLRTDEGNGKIRIYSKENIREYYLTYICKPKPIILKGIDTGLSIEDVEITESISTNGDIGNAPEILHSTILKLAVALAKQAYIGQ